MSRVQLPLRVTSLYLFVIGIILLFPGLTSTVFRTEVTDLPLLFTYAGTILGAAYVIWMIGSDAKYAALASAVVVFEVLHVIAFIVVYVRGQWGLQTVAVPIVVNAALAIWIWLSSRRGSA